MSGCLALSYYTLRKLEQVFHFCFIKQIVVWYNILLDNLQALQCKTFHAASVSFLYVTELIRVDFNVKIAPQLDSK
jgi:hypothetical protein